MSSGFKPLSKERAEQLRQILESSRATSKGMAIDTETGTVSEASLRNDDSDSESSQKRNIIGKFDTHYVF